MAAAANLNLLPVSNCQFWSHDLFPVSAVDIPAKFRKCLSTGGCVIAFCGNFKMASSAILNHYLVIWTTHKVYLSTGSRLSNFVLIELVLFNISRLENLAKFALPAAKIYVWGF